MSTADGRQRIPSVRSLLARDGPSQNALHAVPRGFPQPAQIHTAEYPSRQKRALMASSPHGVHRALRTVELKTSCVSAVVGVLVGSGFDPTQDPAAPDRRAPPLCCSVLDDMLSCESEPPSSAYSLRQRPLHFPASFFSPSLQGCWTPWRTVRGPQRGPSCGSWFFLCVIKLYDVRQLVEF